MSDVAGSHLVETNHTCLTSTALTILHPVARQYLVGAILTGITSSTLSVMSAITGSNFILCAHITRMTGRARFVTDSGFKFVHLTRLALTIMCRVARSQFRGANSTHLTICTFGVAMTSDACGAFVSLTWCFGVQFGWAPVSYTHLTLPTKA